MPMDLAIARRGTRILLGEPQYAPVNTPADPAIDIPADAWRNRDFLLPLVLYAEPAWRRHQIYGWALHTLCLHEPTEELLQERDTHRADLEKFLRSRRLLEGQQILRDGEHLRWYGPPPRRGEPSINVFGMTYVPIYRVLWSFYRPLDEPQSAHRRPIRNRDICPENQADVDHPCVNPLHFKLWSRDVPTFVGIRKNGKPANNWRLSGLHSDIVSWRWNDDDLKVCRKHGHVLSDRYQRMTYLKETDSVYCAGCHKFRQEDRAELRVRKRRVELTADQIEEVQGWTFPNDRPEALPEPEPQDWTDFKI